MADLSDTSPILIFVQDSQISLEKVNVTGYESSSEEDDLDDDQIFSKLTGSYKGMQLLIDYLNTVSRSYLNNIMFTTLPPFGLVFKFLTFSSTNQLI